MRSVFPKKHSCSLALPAVMPLTTDSRSFTIVCGGRSVLFGRPFQAITNDFCSKRDGCCSNYQRGIGSTPKTSYQVIGLFVPWSCWYERIWLAVLTQSKISVQGGLSCTVQRPSRLSRRRPWSKSVDCKRTRLERWAHCSQNDQKVSAKIMSYAFKASQTLTFSI